MRKKDQTVYSVTGARESLTDDLRGRTRRYALSMGLRTLCFLGAIVAPSPWRWILFAGAIVLPYIAVVAANGGREANRNTLAAVDLPLRTQLPPLRPQDRS